MSDQANLDLKYALRWVRLTKADLARSRRQDRCIKQAVASLGDVERNLNKVLKAQAVEATHDLREAVLTALGSGLDDPHSACVTVGDVIAARKLLTLMLDLLPAWPEELMGIGGQIASPPRAELEEKDPATTNGAAGGCAA